MVVCERPGIRAFVSKGSALYPKKVYFTTGAGVPPAVKKLSEFCNEFCWFYVLSLHFAFISPRFKFPNCSFSCVQLVTKVNL